MYANNPKLLNCFKSELPLAFLEELQTGLAFAYQEAFSRGYVEPGLGRSEAEDVTPHIRRALVENCVRELANKHGLHAVATKNKRRTSNYTVISCGKILFTISHINDSSSCSALPRAKFRQQHSALNGLLAQGRFEEFDTDDMVTADGNVVYAILIHGALGNSSAPEFIEFAIPDENNQEWLDKFPVNKLIEMLHNTAPEGTDSDDKAFPVPRVNRKVQGLGE